MILTGNFFALRTEEAESEFIVVYTAISDYRFLFVCFSFRVLCLFVFVVVVVV